MSRTVTPAWKKPVTRPPPAATSCSIVAPLVASAIAGPPVQEAPVRVDVADHNPTQAQVAQVRRHLGHRADAVHLRIGFAEHALGDVVGAGGAGRDGGERLREAALEGRAMA